MDSPFFPTNRWYQQPDPTYRPFPPSVRGVPVYHEDHRPAERASGPRVVRIPVQFVGSERLDRTGSAVKIQKVFRGFLVRKSLRKIKDIKIEVDEIEARLKRGEVVELVKRDAKERLRMNESLMALLLKLDSICGVDFGVRGCRKAVIRKAIALQERIDAIVAADLDAEEKGEIVDLENEARVTEENCVPTVDLEDSRGMEVEGGEDEVGIVDVGVVRTGLKSLAGGRRSRTGVLKLPCKSRNGVLLFPASAAAADNCCWWAGDGLGN
ncbi:uncharacterized protein LOC130993914 [Salvia miltiorrhiza]|uniref:uncharacterized protein LOC130993914 n=1 Tax=Salvia miltiorrhiza TaxID=226208 RepID=UPI0025AD466A|nr:uncharacterized protein LOC130993914 [Salvia miltiorrhiza]